MRYPFYLVILVISKFFSLLSIQKHYWKSVSLKKGKNLKRVMIFGDSNAFRPGNNKNCWPAQLQKLGRSYIQVINESCDGRTTRYDSGLLNGLSLIDDKINANKPLDYVIVALGTNDLKKKYGPPSADEIAVGVEKILEHIVEDQSGMHPVLLTPPRLGEVISGELAGAQSLMPAVAATYRLVAVRQQIPVVDIYSLIDVTADLYADSVHLNENGRNKVVKAVWAHINSYCGIQQRY